MVGAFAPRFATVCEMGIAAKRVVVAASCAALSGESLCLQAFAEGGNRAEGCRGASRGCAGTGQTPGGRALLGSAPGRSEGCSPSAVGGVG